jgi:hypothetical protein
LLKSKSFLVPVTGVDSLASLAVAGNDLYVPFASQKMDDGSTLILGKLITDSQTAIRY